MNDHDIASIEVYSKRTNNRYEHYVRKEILLATICTLYYSKYDNNMLLNMHPFTK